jgi:hypothetical protein
MTVAKKFVMLQLLVYQSLTEFYDEMSFLTPRIRKKNKKEYKRERERNARCVRVCV